MPDFLYIHIPFCVRKCLYCDFFSLPYDESLVKAYTKALCRELVLKRELSGKLKAIYIGGGTPSLLPGECFVQLFECLRDHFNLSPSAEITIEANPGTLNESTISTILSLGVNRISIGIQSFDDHDLKTLGRIHAAAEALKSVELIRRAGITNFSMDLIYGIPGQTINSWRNTISKTIECSPTHVSTYELTPEENTPLFGLIKSGGIEMLDEESTLEMYHHAIDSLTKCGYEHYEVSNFAVAGSGCIHNLNYWDRGEYIGAGAGAHSFVGKIRSVNKKDISGYIYDLDRGIIPEAECAPVCSSDALKEFIFLGLRKTNGVDILRAGASGRDLLNASRDMIDRGHLEVIDGYLRFTRKGVVISNTIIVRLFETLGL